MEFKMIALLLGAQLTSVEINKQIIYQSLIVIDWAQTRDIAKSPYFRESNVFLGENPNIGEVNTYFALTSAIHLGVTLILPTEYRSIWQNVTIGVASVNITRNAYYGVKLDFPF